MQNIVCLLNVKRGGGGVYLFQIINGTQKYFYFEVSGHIGLRRRLFNCIALKNKLKRPFAFYEICTR